ncbi:hypothetical protein OUZ56_024411 [Daphnia magna]|uniref:Uncharacterized protein n=1 Tax=Daphnia magna TaxID=35525 RepID=A0ABR0B0S9_9CRUS|nr:hypothetical protein OUZ56_024411 [Daphnia magna]
MDAMLETTYAQNFQILKLVTINDDFVLVDKWMLWERFKEKIPQTEKDSVNNLLGGKNALSQGKRVLQNADI